MLSIIDVEEGFVASKPHYLRGCVLRLNGVPWHWVTQFPSILASMAHIGLGWHEVSPCSFPLGHLVSAYLRFRNLGSIEIKINLRSLISQLVSFFVLFQHNLSSGFNSVSQCNEISFDKLILLDSKEFDEVSSFFCIRCLAWFLNLVGVAVTRLLSLSLLILQLPFNCVF